ncbi:TPA: polymer-forming cytoskeletal protein [Salmonella enterica subsp. salamae serovar 56:l,v:z39]|nr:polymer-forming cytoskeletal protein [Salmonella enterica subsp. salamae serovar 56:l,v:z39]
MRDGKGTGSDAGDRPRQGERCPLLYLVYALWLSGLAARLAGQNGAAAGLLGLTLIFLAGVFLPLPRGVRMFSKKKTPAVVPENPDTVGLKNSVSPEKGLTIIGSGTMVEGNILQGKNVEIYGTFTGDICLADGTVSILPGGRVKGTVSAACIRIGGQAEGRYEGQSVMVLAQGQLTGTCRSVTFSIIPGGTFVGTAEAWPDAPVLAGEGLGCAEPAQTLPDAGETENNHREEEYGGTAASL